MSNINNSGTESLIFFVSLLFCALTVHCQQLLLLCYGYLQRQRQRNIYLSAIINDVETRSSRRSPRMWMRVSIVTAAASKQSKDCRV